MQSQRERDKRRVASGENKLRMERRQAAKYELSVEDYREMRALVVVFAWLRRRNKPLLVAKACEECGKEFQTRIHHQVQCGREECRRKRASRQGSGYIMRRYYEDTEFRDQLIANANARRASKLGLGSRRITVGYLLERDRWVCGICRKKIKHRVDASIDHIVPLSLGGLHDLANVQASHRRCNYAKGNRGGGEQTRLIG